MGPRMRIPRHHRVDDIVSMEMVSKESPKRNICPCYLGGGVDPKDIKIYHILSSWSDTSTVPAVYVTLPEWIE